MKPLWSDKTVKLVETCTINKNYKKYLKCINQTENTSIKGIRVTIKKNNSL